MFVGATRRVALTKTFENLPQTPKGASWRRGGLAHQRVYPPITLYSPQQLTSLPVICSPTSFFYQGGNFIKIIFCRKLKVNSRLCIKFNSGWFPKSDPNTHIFRLLPERSIFVSDARPKRFLPSLDVILKAGFKVNKLFITLLIGVDDAV